MKNLKKNNFIIVVPARFGSKSIKNKNIIQLNSVPMISYTFESIKKINLPKFALSNDPRVLKIAKKFNIDCSYKRPKKVSGDKSLTITLLKDFHRFAKKKIDYNYIVLLQPTSPIRNTNDILNSISKTIKHKYLKLSSISKSLEHPYESVYINDDNIESFFPKKKHTRRQDFDKDSYFINGSLYIYHKSILEEKKPIKHKEGYYIMKKINSFDIDDHEDLEIVEKILKK